MSAPVSGSARSAASLVGSLVLAGYAAGVVAVWGFVVDDSYIGYRYAVHWADGLGLVWNPGEAPSEGFTNFLWLIVLGTAHRVGFDIILASRVLGVAALIGHAFLVAATTRTVIGRPDRPIEMVPFALLLLNPQLVSHSVSGMETTAFAFALSLTVWLSVRVAWSDVPRARDVAGCALSVLLAGMIRPEGVAFGGLCLLAVLILKPGTFRSRQTWWALAVAGLAGAVYFIWRWNYFGYPLPNPFYHKRNPGLIAEEGFRYVGHFGLYLSPLLLVVAAQWRTFDRRLLVALAVPGLLTGMYMLFIPEMGFNDRFTVVYYFLSTILAAVALRDVRERRWKGLTPVWARAVFAMVTVGLVVVQARELSDVRLLVQAEERNAPGGKRAHLGVQLGTLPQDLVMAAGEVGTMPWFSGLATVDVAGLTDTYVTHNPTTVDYLLKRNVELLIVPRHRDTLDIGHDSLDNSSRYYQLYEQQAALYASYFLAGCSDGYLLFVKREPRGPALQRHLRAVGISPCAKPDVD